MRRLPIALIGAVSAIAFTQIASAADMTTPATFAARAYIARPYIWSGCYIGIEGGGNWGRSKHTDITSPNPVVVGLPITNDFDLSGGLVGGTVGCNYQVVANWVFGIENDFSWTSKQGSASDLPPFGPATSQTSEKWLDTLRGRIGVAWDRALFYGTGGVAFAGTAVDVCAPGACVSDSQTRTGWVGGIGIEYSVWQNVFFKIEYLHADFGTSRYIDPSVTLLRVVPRDVSLTDEIVRIGINYKLY